MPGIEFRKRIAEFRIDRIHFTFETGTDIKRLTPGISGLELEATGEALFEACLERVVIGIADGVFGEDVGEDGHAIGGTTNAGEVIAVGGGILAQADQG